MLKTGISFLLKYAIEVKLKNTKVKTGTLHL